MSTLLLRSHQSNGNSSEEDHQIRLEGWATIALASGLSFETTLLRFLRMRFDGEVIFAVRASEYCCQNNTPAI
jgi:hypothetical protein